MREKKNLTSLRRSKPPPSAACIKLAVNYSDLYHVDILWLYAVTRQDRHKEKQVSRKLLRIM